MKLMAPVSTTFTCFCCFVFAFYVGGTVDGADEAGATGKSATDVAKTLEEAYEAVIDGLETFYTDDAVIFVIGLLNTVGKLSRWFEGLTKTCVLIPPLIDPNPPSDPDLQILKTALKKISDSFSLLMKINFNFETVPVVSVALDDLRKNEASFFDLVTEFYEYLANPSIAAKYIFVLACEKALNGVPWTNEIHRDISYPAVNLAGYFEDTCNYTEVLYRSRRVATFFMLTTQLISFCSATIYWNSTGFISTIPGRAKSLEEQWAGIAGKLHENLGNKKTLKNCLFVFTDSLESYSKPNQELGHEKFAQGLASHLFEKFPWINWYVFSYDDGLGGADEHFCIGGILSHCIQRKYGRNLFVAGQQAENEYFYNRKCPEQRDCVAKLDYYKNCQDATKPFAQCIREKCKPPAGTLCKKSSDGFAAEKGSSASSDGWNKLNFGKDKKYSMHVVSP